MLSSLSYSTNLKTRQRSNEDLITTRGTDTILLSKMLSLSRLISMTLASVALTLHAAALSVPPEVTGPQATLVVSSAMAAPDGFERP